MFNPFPCRYRQHQQQAYSSLVHNFRQTGNSQMEENSCLQFRFFGFLFAEKTLQKLLKNLRHADFSVSCTKHASSHIKQLFNYLQQIKSLTRQGSLRFYQQIHVWGIVAFIFLVLLRSRGIQRWSLETASLFTPSGQSICTMQRKTEEA